VQVHKARHKSTPKSRQCWSSTSAAELSNSQSAFQRSHAASPPPDYSKSAMRSIPVHMVPSPLPPFFSLSRHVFWEQMVRINIAGPPLVAFDIHVLSHTHNLYIPTGRVGKLRMGSSIVCVGDLGCSTKLLSYFSTICSRINITRAVTLCFVERQHIVCEVGEKQRPRSGYIYPGHYFPYLILDGWYYPLTAFKRHTPQRNQCRILV